MNRSLPSDDGKRIKSLDTAFHILDILSDGQVTQSEITDRVDHSKSTVHYYLKTLESRRYVVRTDDGYRLGLRCLELAETALEQHGFPTQINEEVEKLAEQVGATAVIATEESGKCIHLHVHVPDDDCCRAYRVGTEYPLHATAVGKAVMAHLGREEVVDIVDHYGLPEMTDNTITDREALFSELSTIREQEVAVDDGEHLNGIKGIAAPVFDDDAVYGAVGIVAPRTALEDSHSRFKAQRFAKTPVNAVKRSARLIGNKLSDADE